MFRATARLVGARARDQRFAIRVIASAASFGFCGWAAERQQWSPCEPSSFVTVPGASVLAGVFSNAHRLAHCETIAAPGRDFFENIAKDHFQPLLDESALWKRECTRQGDGYCIAVFSSPSKSALTRGLRYRVDITLEPALAERTSTAAAFRQLMCYEDRLKWDVNINFGETLLPGEKIAPEEVPEVARYRTNPAACGVITSREFIDARVVLSLGNVPGKLMVSTRWDDVLDLPVTKGTTRGFNVPGCGFAHIWHDSSGAMHIILFGQSELGGWLPVQLVNSASAGAYAKFGLTLLKGLGVA